MTLIRNVTKTPEPYDPFRMVGEIYEVGGSASVPLELHMEGLNQTGEVGVDIVFLIDHSGSMGGSDPDNNRFYAIEKLIDEFEPTRNHLDRISIILFYDDNAVPMQGWKNWHETRSTIEELIDEDLGGLTPMEDGMKQANQLLIDTNGFYKIVILPSG